MFLDICTLSDSSDNAADEVTQNDADDVIWTHELMVQVPANENEIIIWPEVQRECKMHLLTHSGVTDY